MARKLITIGVLGLVLAVSGCRNPDDRKSSADTELVAR